MIRAKNCGTCSLADFERTPTGRIKRNYVGTCAAPFPPQPEVPACVTIKFERSRVWPDQGSECPTYKRVSK